MLLTQEKQKNPGLVRFFSESPDEFGLRGYLIDVDKHQREVQHIEKIEAANLKTAVPFMPVPFLRSTLRWIFVSFLPDSPITPVYQDIKKELYESQSRKTSIRKDFCFSLLVAIENECWLLYSQQGQNYQMHRDMNLDHRVGAFDRIEKMKEMLRKDGENSLKESTVIAVLDELKNLRKDIELMQKQDLDPDIKTTVKDSIPNITDDQVKGIQTFYTKQLGENLNLLQKELSYQWDERTLKFDRRVHEDAFYYFPLREEHKDRNDFDKRLASIRFGVELLKNLFLLLGIVGLILSIAAMCAFPALGGTAAIIVAVATIGYCSSDIIINGLDLVGWLHFIKNGGTITTGQLINGGLGAFYLILDVIFFVSAVGVFLPAAATVTTSSFKVIATIRQFLFTNAAFVNLLGSILSLVSKCTISILGTFVFIKNALQDYREWRSVKEIEKISKHEAYEAAVSIPETTSPVCVPAMASTLAHSSEYLAVRELTRSKDLETQEQRPKENFREDGSVLELQAESTVTDNDSYDSGLRSLKRSLDEICQRVEDVGKDLTSTSTKICVPSEMTNA